MTKTRKFLIVSHGGLARGIKSSLELIAGAVDGLYVLEAYVEENKPIEEELSRLFAEEEVEWVVFSDLLGGSVTNQVLRAGNGKAVHVVAGFNLPLVIEVVLSDPGLPVEEILEEAIGRAREQLVYVNPLLTQPDKDA
jgi:fructoselysine and glucoselysine-specific PTS system IIA component